MLKFMSLVADTATTTVAGNLEGATGVMALLTGVLPFALILVLMYFMMIRPQRKKQKEEQQMRNSIRVGDEITTIGGIVGRVVTVKDETLVIETGANCNKMVIKKWALQSCDTVHDAAAEDDDDDDDI